MREKLSVKLNGISRNFDELSAQMADPSIFERPGAYQKLAREVGKLEPLVNTWRRYEHVCDERLEAEQLFRSESDAELKALAQEEAELLREEQETLEEKLQELLIPRDPDDEKDLILEIRAGTGGDEAALFCADLFRMYGRFAEQGGLKLEILSSTDSDAGGYKEIICTVAGEGAYGQLKFESGVHRVQRVPATESQGRIHTSACTVAVLPELDEEIDIEIREDDLRMDVFRASGAGGQHVNRTNSAVRLTHIPSGLVVACQAERSQHKNRATAMKMLKAKLYDLEQEKLASENTNAKRAMVGSGDRSEKIRTYNYPQNRVTDHRINLSIYSLGQLMDGALEPLIKPLQVAAQAAMIEAEQRQLS